MVSSSRNGFESLILFTLLLATCSLPGALGFDNTRSDNLAVYYGQNSYGATHTSDTANWQQTLSHYCQDDAINVFPLAFLNVFFSTGGLPELNMANTCNNVDNPVFSGTSLANCQSLAADIQACQAKGKIITLSLGGATGAATFSSNAQAQAFADTIWNLFLGGTSSTRPFGSAVLDGIDLDIEGGGSTGYAAFVTQIRSHASGASKPYYVTAAPQCPFPDAYLGSVINAVGFDAIYVQFYNNYCGLQAFNDANSWNFDAWDNWAKNTSPNKNVKVYIGAPASSTAATTGYVSAANLGSYAVQTRAQYSSFGGVMLWDASQAYANGRFDLAVKNAISTGGTITTTSTTKTTTSSTTKTTSTTSSTSKTTTTTTTTSTGGSGSCSGVSAWSPTATYVGGNTVTYSSHLWTAQWWSYDDTPGGAAGVWTDNGACSTKLAMVTEDISASRTLESLTADRTTGSAAIVTAIKSASDSKSYPASPAKEMAATRTAESLYKAAPLKTGTASNPSSSDSAATRKMKSRFFRV